MNVNYVLFVREMFVFIVCLMQDQVIKGVGLGSVTGMFNFNISLVII